MRTVHGATPERTPRRRREHVELPLVALDREAPRHQFAANLNLAVPPFFDVHPSLEASSHTPNDFMKFTSSDRASKMALGSHIWFSYMPMPSNSHPVAVWDVSLPSVLPGAPLQALHTQNEQCESVKNLN